MSMLTQAQAKELEDAIGRAEAQSAGELVVAVVPRCARYGEERLMIAAVWGVGLCFLAHHLLPDVPCMVWMAAQLPLIAVLYRILRTHALLRWLVGRARRESAVQARAYQVFAQRGVHKTRDRTGLLIFIAEAEHHVVILGDQGVDTIVGAAGWARYVDTIVAGIREGALTRVLVGVIDELGGLIARHHPHRPDDTNELPDTVVVE